MNRLFRALAALLIVFPPVSALLAQAAPPEPVRPVLARTQRLGADRDSPLRMPARVTA